MLLRKLRLFMAMLTVSAMAVSLCFANDFDLNSASLNDADGKMMDVPAARPASVYEQKSAVQTLDMSIRIPFQALNRVLAESASEELQIIDQQKPVIVPAGDTIRLSNLLVSMNGVDIKPVISLKPYFEAVDRIAIKIVKVDVSISMGPDKSAGMGIDKNEIMAQVMEQLTKTVQVEITKALAVNKLSLKAEDLLLFQYDRDTWTLHAIIKPTFISPLVENLLPSLDLTAFSFDKDTLTLGMHTSSLSNLSKASAVSNMLGINCDLTLNDVLVTYLMYQMTKGSSFDLLPSGHPGGVSFIGNNRMTVSGKTIVSSLPLHPPAYFTARMNVTLPLPGVINVVIEDINVEKVGLLGIPSMVNKLLSDMIISSAVDTIVSDKDMARVLKARKIGNNAMEITFKPAAFLPSVASGTRLTYFKIGAGNLSMSLEM